MERKHIRCIQFHSLYLFPRDGITNNYKPGGPKQQNLFAHSCGEQKSNIKESHTNVWKSNVRKATLSIGSRGESYLFPFSFQKLQVFLDLGQHDTNLCLLLPDVSPLFIRRLDFEFRAQPVNLRCSLQDPLLSYICKELFFFFFQIR